MSSNSELSACTQHELKQLFLIFTRCWKSSTAVLRLSKPLELLSGEDVPLLILNLKPCQALRAQLTGSKIGMQETESPVAPGSFTSQCC